jgi:hypothetical protein
MVWVIMREDARLFAAKLLADQACFKGDDRFEVRSSAMTVEGQHPVSGCN